MTSQPKVSVVIPIYNMERYLDACLRSVRAQTLDNLEIVCVDDGSSDSSPQIIARHASDDCRIRVVTQENRGYGAAMNAGIDAATGEYVGSVEPDDLVDKDMFRRLYETAHKHRADVVKGDFYTFTGDDPAASATRFEIAPGKCLYGKVFDCTRLPIMYTVFMMTWEGIYRREFITKNGIRHNESPGASFQDNGFWFQTMGLARRMVLLNEAHYYYRTDNDGSSTNTLESSPRIIGEYHYIRRILERDPQVWDRLKSVYACYYLTNLMTRYLHATEDGMRELAHEESDFYHEAVEKGFFDPTLLPEFFDDELREMAEDPDGYDASKHQNLEVTAWQEVQGRVDRTEIPRDMVSPYGLLRRWPECVVE